MKQHQPQNPFKKHLSQYRPKDRVISLNSAAWQTLRREVLADQPLCQHCYDDYRRITPATDVDHKDNNGDNNDRHNLQSLCHSCHSRKTRAEMLRQTRRVYGCDVNGWPLDPNHHWRQKKITSNQSAKDRMGTHINAGEDGEF